MAIKKTEKLDEQKQKQQKTYQVTLNRQSRTQYPSFSPPSTPPPTNQMIKDRAHVRIFICIFLNFCIYNIPNNISLKYPYL